MAKTITITGKGALDEAQKAEALQWLADNATTDELIKLKKLAGNPLYRGMLKSL